MLRVGLTGGIGSGKSTVARLLGELGALVVDGDQVAREVVEPGTEALAQIAAAFGDTVLREDGTLDRPGLAAIVFPDRAQLERLEAITQPAIAARLTELTSAAPRDSIVVYDMPLLVEKRLWPAQHLTVVVGASEATRLERLVHQRGMPEQDARARMATQATDEERRLAADGWVDNDGDWSATEAQVRALWHNRLVPFNENLLTGTRSRRPERNAIVEPDPTWPAKAARLVARVEHALGNRALTVDHIGSTAVPRLIAKDVIDLQVGVRALEDADDTRFVAALTGAGFLLVPHVAQDDIHGVSPEPRQWQKRFFGSTDPARVTHVHVREVGSAGWRFALLFRDWLRTEPLVRERYAVEKRRLLAADPRTDSYTERKAEWFSTAYGECMQWGRRMRWEPTIKQPR